MVERVADRLWIVADGKVDGFDGDLEDYRKYIVQAARDAKKKDKKAASDKKDKKQSDQPKRSLGMIEDEIERLTAEKEKLEAKMADAYSEDVQAEYDRVSAALEAAEAEFLSAAA